MKCPQCPQVVRKWGCGHGEQVLPKVSARGYERVYNTLIPCGHRTARALQTGRGRRGCPQMPCGHIEKIRKS